MGSEKSTSVADYISGVALLSSDRVLLPHTGFTQHVLHV